MSEAQRLGADPYFHRALPLDELSAHALQASALEHSVPGRAGVAASGGREEPPHGALACPDPPVRPDPGPARWPLTAGMTTRAGHRRGGDGAGGAGFRRRARPARCGLAARHGLGDRAKLPRRSRSGDALRRLVAAARQAYARSRHHRSRRPRSTWRKSPTRRRIRNCSPMRRCGLCARERLGGARGGWQLRARRARCRSTCPAACMTFNPVFCTGLIRIAEIANQVRGRAGPHQLRRTRAAAWRMPAAGSPCSIKPPSCWPRQEAGGAGMSADRVGIIGIGQSDFRSRRDDASYPDLVREARRAGDAGRQAGFRRDRGRGLFAVAGCDGRHRQCRAAWRRCGGRAQQAVPAHQHRRRHRHLQRSRRRITTSRPASATSC